MSNFSSDPVKAASDGAPLQLQSAIPPAMRLAAMLEHPTLAVASVQRGRIREINAAWHLLFALPPDVSVESHVATLFPNGASADRFERRLKLEITTARHATLAVRSEQLLMRRDGNAFLCELIVWLLGSGDAEHPLGGDSIWQVRDVTVERALRRDLRDLGDYHRELSQHHAGITIVIDGHGRLSYASSSIERLLGYPVNQLLGEPFASLLDPEGAAAAQQVLRAASRPPGFASLDAGDGPFHLRLTARDGAARDFAGRAIDCFKSRRIAGLVVQLVEADTTAGRDRSMDVSAAAACLRASLLEAMRIGDAFGTEDEGLAALLRMIRTCLDVASAVCWQRADPPVAVWTVRSSDLVTHVVTTGTGEAMAVPPLVRADATAGAERLLVIADVKQEATLAPAVVGDLLVSRTAAIVEVPMVVGARMLGWLAVGAALPRRWLDAELDFIVGGALLIARVLERSTGAASATDHVPSRGTAGRDPLTGLPGRADAERYLAASTVAADAAAFVVFAIDLDHLQDVNDSRGRSAGDTVIRRTAAVLTNVVGANGYVARVDGDEFLAIVPDADVHDVAATTQAMLDRIADVGDDVAIGMQVEASIGVTRFPIDAFDDAALWRHAGVAMREAKLRGRGHAFVFNPKLATSLRSGRTLDVEIDEALKRGQFTVFYQPQVSFASGLATGFEALLRWEHPTRGLLLPDAFIQAAFQRGLVDVITKLVLTRVCEQIDAWRRSAATLELPVSVNVSGKQFHDRRLPALVASALLRSGLPARLLVLEITEQSLVGDHAGIERVVKELSRLGVRIAIGDFNLGHASFSYLRQLNVSQIKLGGHFVKGLPGDAEEATLVASVVDLAHRLKYEVVAEGVETRPQFDHLRAIGCEAGQGYLLGAPLSADEVGSYLESNRQKPFH